MKKIKLYDIHGASTIENYLTLITPDSKYFYWDSKRFSSYLKDDIVFWVNRTARVALYTRVDSIDIKPSFNNGRNIITDLGYDVSATAQDPSQFETFYRFKILEKVDLPENWNYSNIIPFNGQTMAIILFEEKINEPDKKIIKIEDLKIVFQSKSEIIEILNEAINRLQKMKNVLYPEIVEAINSTTIQEALKEKDFHFEKAQIVLSELENYPEPSPSFYSDLLGKFISSKKTYKVFIKDLNPSSEDYKFLIKVATLISYCDKNAANKNELNEYSDKRTIAKSFVRQTTWVENIINYKVNRNDLKVLSPSILNAIVFIKTPEKGLTMLSEGHREMFSKYLLKRDVYEKEAFVNDVIEFMTPYGLIPRNQNFTYIISLLFYSFPKIKKLWFDRVEGLVAQDSTDWFQSALDDIKETGKMILWWSKVPTGRAKVDKLLVERIRENGSFYFFYMQKNQAMYRARVVDFAYEDDYNKKLWNKNNDVAWYKESFSGYTDDTNKNADIVFLVDEFIKLDTPIPVEKFEFYNGEPPRNINLQSYSELDWEEEDVKIKKNVWLVTQGSTYSSGITFLWAPEKGKKGQIQFYWDNVLKVKQGDIIFNYSAGIRGVSIATSDGYRAKNPYQGNEWDTEGYKVDIESTDLDPALYVDLFRQHKDNLRIQLKGIQNKPFQTDGSANLGYLYEFTDSAGKYVRDVMYKKKFGQEEIDEFFDNANLIKDTEKPAPMETRRTSDIIKHVHSYMSSKGFQYKLEEIANFYLAIKTKPFVILAGISGTGKSQLPRKFASAIGMKDEQVKLLPVRPDWTDGSDLLGYTSLDGKFIPKDLTLAIKDAKANPADPYFFILDEMNLARVEHYFSDFLSIIETRSWDNGKIKTDPILRKETIQNASNASEFENFQWPQNLYLIGTVNMDETTHAFSKKVLDRANSIEMNEVDLNWIPSSIPVEILDGVSNSLFATEYIDAKDLSDRDRVTIKNEIELLIKVNNILEKADLHFAYRVRDEVAFYLILNKRYNLLEDKVALDFQIVQKVLPRVHGSSERVQVLLVELLNLLEATDYRTSGFEYSHTAKIDLAALKYPRTSKKILFMLKRFDDDRFTSFWL